MTIDRCQKINIGTEPSKFTIERIHQRIARNRRARPASG
jgi:hypothetical protein